MKVLHPKQCSTFGARHTVVEPLCRWTCLRESEKKWLPDDCLKLVDPSTFPSIGRDTDARQSTRCSLTFATHNDFDKVHEMASVSLANNSKKNGLRSFSTDQERSAFLQKSSRHTWPHSKHHNFTIWHAFAVQFSRWTLPWTDLSIDMLDLVENWLNNDMIGETGVVENFDVSLSSSFIRKSGRKDSKKESVGFIYNPVGAMFWGWSVSGCEIGAMGAVGGVGDAWTVWGVYRRLRNAWIVWECVQETKKSQRVTKMALQTNVKVQHQFQRPCWSMSKGCLRRRGALSRHAPSGDVGRPPLVWRWAH